MSLQQNGRRSFTPLPCVPPVLRAKARGLMGSFKTVFMFITDCKRNKIPLPLRKGSGEVCKVCLLEIHPHVELAGRDRPHVPVPWPWEGKPPPAASSTLESPLDVESTGMVWRALLQGPGSDIKGRYGSLFPTRGSCRPAPLPSAGVSSCAGPEAIMEQAAQEGARAKILFLTCFLFI